MTAKSPSVISKTSGQELPPGQLFPSGTVALPSFRTNIRMPFFFEFFVVLSIEREHFVYERGGRARDYRFGGGNFLFDPLYCRGFRARSGSPLKPKAPKIIKSSYAGPDCKECVPDNAPHPALYRHAGRR
jgi:hypothetical protein